MKEARKKTTPQLPLNHPRYDDDDDEEEEEDVDDDGDSEEEGRGQRKGVEERACW